ncbi:hypothetical protein D6T64_03345 [Cryobacterium melibiosiphilum]|uniref:FHA domain-containing protein n=2 Tax=Cryobacterium melibiosiphilum TaxID=995039 RepID=A0A3A5MMW0_9MICO|nr:hypothetical protein D6T64_03345 [Cryobacterium melibiosiphilum]
MFCGECGSSTSATPLTRRRPDPRGRDTTIIQPLPRSTVISVSVPDRVPAPPPVERIGPVPTSAPAESAPAVLPDPVAAPITEPPATRPDGVRFVLQFSTGETVNVHGSGLIGRRPLPQPGEIFDHLVQIQDSGMSVSKSHLEFGQHGGQFWVSDRFSGNGSVLQRPSEGALRCEPGRRYLVPRGSRVDIADQYFVLA